jgi:flagellar M-ring protein FliF
MDFLHQSFAQLKDLFQSMTPGARITTGLLLVVVVVSVAYLFTHAAAGPDVYLLDATSVSYGELNAMQAALGNANLPFELEGNRIRIPRGEKYKYMAALSTADALPRSFGDYLENAVANQSVFASGKSSEQLAKIGKQKELARTISAFDWAETADVFFDEDTKGGLRRDKVKTASVSVRPFGTGELEEGQVKGICSLMVGSIAGLKAENVKILDMRTGRYHRVDSEELDASGGTRDRIKQKYEKEYKGKVERLLIDIPDAIVATNVELTPEKSIFEETTKYDPKTVPLHTAEQTSSRTFTGEEPSGRPGYYSQTNSARGLTGAQRKGSEETEDTTDLTQSNLASGTRSTREIEGHDIVRVVASISIPSTYFVKLWHQENDVEGQPPVEPDEATLAQKRAQVISSIQSVVASQLQVGATKVDPAELVQVGVFSPIVPEPIPEASLTENAVAWLGQSWSTLGLIGLGFFSLLMIRSMVKSSPASEAGEAVAVEANGSDGETASGEPQRKLTRFGTSGKSLKEELSELVAEDPDTAAVILRNWIGNVSNSP